MHISKKRQRLKLLQLIQLFSADEK